MKNESRFDEEKVFREYIEQGASQDSNYILRELIKNQTQYPTQKFTQANFLHEESQAHDFYKVKSLFE